MNRAKTKNSRTPSDKYWIIVPAAGLGRRMGAEIAKQYLRIGTKTILELTLDRLSQLDKIEKIILVLHPDDSSWKFLNHDQYKNVVTVVGDDERWKSVLNGLLYLQTLANDRDWVLVHDAVRPCVTVSDMKKLMATLSLDPVGGLLAAPVRETIKQSDANDIVIDTPDRNRLWLAGTPQMFRYGILMQAVTRVLENGSSVTDEASAVEAMGREVHLVKGRNDNIKVTHPEDLLLIEAVLALGQDLRS
ncbi:MAG: 2-C-methyl-D-erythritol 4-phosphate cytidylyltransferase [Pseudomonadales bacterium]|nr:2-C-methyl-D-erythritol 4-phosphate cytidylyltransferase [Pseudomonadales bacterium]